MITITIAPVTPAQVAAVTKFMQDYPVLTPLENFKVEPPKTTPRASSARASPAPVQESPTQTTSLTLEEVRAKLTDISQAGKKTEVSALIAEFGATKLTEVKSEDYAALMAKAEKL